MGAGSGGAHSVCMNRQMWVGRGLEKIPSLCRCQSFKTRRCDASWDPMSAVHPTSQPPSCPPQLRWLTGWTGGEGKASAHRLTFVLLSKPTQVTCHSKQMPAEEKTQQGAALIPEVNLPTDLYRTFLPTFFLLISRILAFPFVSVLSRGCHGQTELF